MKEENVPEQEWTEEDPQTTDQTTASPEASGKRHRRLSKRGDPLNAAEGEHEKESKGEDDAPASAGKRKNSVVTYIAILFSVAFLLLLLAYFMQQRNAAQMLRESNSAMENIELLQQRNIELDKQVDDLTAQLQACQKQLEEGTDQASSLAEVQKQNQALDAFWPLVKAYESGASSTCRRLITQMEEAGLVESLPSQGAESAAAEFAAIQKAVMD